MHGRCEEPSRGTPPFSTFFAQHLPTGVRPAVKGHCKDEIVVLAAVVRYEAKVGLGEGGAAVVAHRDGEKGCVGRLDTAARVVDARLGGRHADNAAVEIDGSLPGGGQRGV